MYDTRAHDGAHARTHEMNTYVHARLLCSYPKLSKKWNFELKFVEDSGPVNARLSSASYYSTAERPVPKPGDFIFLTKV